MKGVCDVWSGLKLGVKSPSNRNSGSGKGHTGKLASALMIALTLFLESAPIFDPFADADSDCPPAGVCPF